MFTIVVPVYNGMPWLPEAIGSILGQQVETELIVLDAGSSDGSRTWLRQHVAGIASLIFEPDDGQADAIARGFALASGELLGWLNADDLLEPGALRQVIDTFSRRSDAVAVSGGCGLIDSEGTSVGAIPLPPDASLQRLLRHPTNLAQPATFFRAEAYRQVGGVSRQLKYAMDVDLWLRLARLGPIVLVPKQRLAQFRVHSDAKTATAAAAMAREDLRVRLRHGMPFLSRAAIALARRGYLRPLKQWVLSRFP